MTGMEARMVAALGEGKSVAVLFRGRRLEVVGVDIDGPVFTCLDANDPTGATWRMRLEDDGTPCPA